MTHKTEKGESHHRKAKGHGIREAAQAADERVSKVDEVRQAAEQAAAAVRAIHEQLAKTQPDRTEGPAQPADESPLVVPEKIVESPPVPSGSIETSGTTPAGSVADSELLPTGEVAGKVPVVQPGEINLPKITPAGPPGEPVARVLRVLREIEKGTRRINENIGESVAPAGHIEEIILDALKNDVAALEAGSRAPSELPRVA